MRVRLTLRGSCWTVLVVEDDRGRCQVEDFLESLSRDNFRELRRIQRRLETLGNRGTPRNDKYYRHVDSSLFEAKTAKTRVLCWQQADYLVLLEAFTKMRDRIPPQVLVRARGLATELPSLIKEYERGV